MKQLLDTCETYIIVGLNVQAFVVHQDSTICELVPEAQQRTAAEQKSGVNPNEVQAVAITAFQNKVWCAVSRHNKTLSLYELDKNLNSSTTSTPTTVQRLAKRALCLTFATINGESPLNIVIAGDLIGDATAYSLTDANTSRLLLGHTASMLTGVQVRQECILTCDRDEKIRASAFPQTFVIEGYLLGHEAFITCMDAGQECITCGGDGTVRLWNYRDFTQLAVFEVEDKLLPTRIAMSPNGRLAAVIYNDNNRIDILSTTDSSLESVQTIMDCPSQPLSIKFVSNDCILILAREPEYLLEYKRQEENGQFTLHPDSHSAVRQLASSRNIVMPPTLMEVDGKSGQLKLQKEMETRGPSASDKPWNKVERVQKAKEASSRRSKRRRLGKQAHDTTSSSKDE